MKKITAILASAAILLSLTACGKTESTSRPTTENHSRANLRVKSQLSILRTHPRL